MERVYFISDAHLGITHPRFRPREEVLYGFLRDIRGSASALVIGGDFFDYWLEYDHGILPQYFEVLHELRCLRDEGCALHYVIGNHDFGIETFLEERIGMTVHRDEFSAVIQGKRVVVRHGDGFVKMDLGFRMARAILRNPVNLALYKLLPPYLGVPLAAKVSFGSRAASHDTLTPEREARYTEAARKYLVDDDRADILLLGHIHKALVHRFGDKVYCNTGEWIERPAYAKLEDGRFDLFTLDEGTGRFVGAA